MSGISANYNVTPYNPTTTGTQGTDSTTPTSTENKTLTVTLNVANSSETGGPVAITLTYPLIGVEDIPLNELLQQLDGIDMAQFQGMTLAETVVALDKIIADVAQGIIDGGEASFHANKEQLIKVFEGLEKALEQAVTELYDLISNSNYPNFQDFLKEMLQMAQDLREEASKVKHAAIMGEFNNVLAQAEHMKTGAQERYNKALEDIKAKQIEAGMQLVGAVASLAISGLAIGKFGVGSLQSFSSISMAASQGLGAIGSLASTGAQTQAAQHEKNAALLDAQIKELDATNKLMQEGQSVAQELSDIAKQLRDMVLKLYQDFLTSQNQIIQRSNI